MSHWKHNLTTTKVHGKWKGTCTCGWQSEKFSDVSQVTEDYRLHTKLIEKEPNRKGEE